MTLRPKFQEAHVDIVRSFLRHHLEASARKGFVVTMSGGLDSSLVAKLCADAVGPAKVLGLALPDAPGGRDERDARDWARKLGIRFRTIDIGPIIEETKKTLKIGARDRVRLGNVKARVRMIAAYHVAHAEKRLVIGSSNKSELLMGYFTMFGDGGCDFAPIGDLYKTQVREMARHLKLPRRILEKPPTAGLWPGQTDEGELGIAYEDLDRILLGLELYLAPEAIAERTGLPLREVRRVQRRVEQNAHKRKMPLIPKLGVRTLGLDWRE